MLNAKLVEKLVEAGVEKIPVRAEALVGRRTATRIVDTESGEVLVGTNTEVTSTVLSQLMSRRRWRRSRLLVMTPGKVDASIYETLARDHVKNPDEALVEIYRKLRPGDPPTVESARALFRGMFMDARRYDLARVGRFMINEKLRIDAPLSAKTLRSEDIVSVIRHLLMVKLGSKPTDDIDHLGNRRVRSVGELLENQFRVGLTRMERAVKERMSISDITNLMPHDLINAKPVSAVVKEFFGSSQLSQFMDQTNPLAELTHKRRLSALGPRGLSRERAGFEVRDVHPTHYGRICPIETPEGPNIGLISSLSTYARTNEFGFIETPYRKVVGRQVTDEIEFLTALKEEKFVIAQANAEIDRNGKFTQERVSARKSGEFRMVPPEELHYMDVSPKQLVSVAAALIPFLENDDANRALMGSNMQRQAVPLLQPEAPAGRHRHGARGGPRLRRGGGGQASRRGGVRVGRPRGGAGGEPVEEGRPGPGPAARHLQPDQVPPLEPEHLHQPEADRAQGPAGGARATSSPTARARTRASWRWAATCWSPSCRGAATTSRTRSSSPSGSSRTTASPRSTSRSSRSRPATPSWARKRSPATFRTCPKKR